MSQQPERGGEEGEGGSDEESEVDAQDGRPRGETELSMATMNIRKIVGNCMGISMGMGRAWAWAWALTLA